MFNRDKLFSPSRFDVSLEVSQSREVSVGPIGPSSRKLGCASRDYGASKKLECDFPLQDCRLMSIVGVAQRPWEIERKTTWRKLAKGL